MKSPTLHRKLLIIFSFFVISLGAFSWFLSQPLREGRGFPKVMAKNLVAHFDHQIEVLGMPPLRERAVELRTRLDLDVTIYSQQDIVWSTLEDPPGLELLVNEAEKKFGSYRGGKWQSRLFALSARNGFTYAFFLPERDMSGFSLRMFTGFAAVVFFVLLAIFLLTRVLLRPLHPLMEGVKALTSGDLSYRVDIRSRGEFREVSEAFNGMAEALQKQLHSKDKLIMDVSHELRSPLGRMKLAAEMVNDPSMKAQLREDILHMEALVSEILESYRFRSGEMRLDKTPVFLEDLVRGLLPRYRDQAPGVEVQVRGPRAAILADERLLTKAVTNVIENALKFSAHQNVPVQVEIESRPDEVILKTTDHGIGIEAKDLPFVFEPFYRADSSRVRTTGGFGLGLSLAKEIVEAHSGQLSCESAPNKKTIFTMRFVSFREEAPR